VQVGKSVEALTLYLGVLRAGFVFMPLNTAYQVAEIDYFTGNAELRSSCAAPPTCNG
jgi:malonyl-CoA/methylmalonyl-CoA synthetase